MKYKLVIFDFDGTLSNSFPWFRTIADQVAVKYNLRKLEDSEYDAMRGWDAPTTLKYVGVPLWKVPAIGNYLKTLMARDIHLVPLFPGVDDLLFRLAERGITLAIVSSNKYENVRKILGEENAARIHYYECGVSVFGKPPKLRKILRKSGVPAGEVILIGDEIRDLQAAASVGIASGAVVWGYNRREALEAHSPQEVFASIEHRNVHLPV